MLVSGLTICVARPIVAAPAFPLAEGFGANAVGGRGGEVYCVTNLADSGLGTLREAVSKPKRTIIFGVSGTIFLKSQLDIAQPYLTIAGQTAPGGGITLAGHTVSVQDTHDVIVRFIRCRAGDINGVKFQGDAFQFFRATNCIADHVSASWSVDETLSVTRCRDISVQWCFITESLRQSVHRKGSHGYGSLLRFGDGSITLHHNLYAHHDSRNPRLGDNLRLDFINNVIYDWGFNAGYNANDSGGNPSGYTNWLNYVGNLLLAGPSTTKHLRVAFDSGVTNAASAFIYQSANEIDNNRNGRLDGMDTGWQMFDGLFARMDKPFPAPGVTADSPKTAMGQILTIGGASLHRDAVDERIVSEVRKETGRMIDSQAEVGGWPELKSIAAPLDTDRDGIPDYWEYALGWETNAVNSSHINPDGFTDLEWYLNWLAAPHIVCGRNSKAALNLASLVGISKDSRIRAGKCNRGQLGVSPDGRSAEYFAAKEFSGLVHCEFTISDPALGDVFFPLSANVLVLR